MPTGNEDEAMPTRTEDEVNPTRTDTYRGRSQPNMYPHAPRTKSTQQAPRIKPCPIGTKDKVILTHTEDEAMPTYTEDEPHRPYLPPYVCTGNVKFRISKTPLWCQKSFFLIQGTLQMTGHSQRRRHSSDDRAHSQRCGYSSTLSSSLVFRPLPLENFWHPVDDGMPGQWCGHSSDQGTLQMTGHKTGA